VALVMTDDEEKLIHELVVVEVDSRRRCDVEPRATSHGEGLCWPRSI
jgi:hypothetical protein